MGIDAAGISGRVIFEIAGESKNRREFVTGFFVKISVAHAVVEGTMAETLCPALRAFHASRDMESQR